MKKFQMKQMPVAVGGVIAMLFGASEPIHAEGFELEEIVVTARKREESSQDVPVAMSNYSGGDLAALNLTDTNQLGQFSPGVNIEPPAAQGGSATRVTIRGQVQTDNLITLDPSVGWYIDDVYLARTYGTANSIFDLERVEILKGPQGTLYGRNTTGGAIKLVTTKADPFEGVSGYVSGGIGNFDQTKVGGAINIPLVEDKLAVRLVALKDKRDEGFGDVTIYGNASDPLVVGADVYDPTDKKDWGTKDNELYRVGVTYFASEDLSVFLNYEKTESYTTDISYNDSNEPGNQGDLPNGPSIFPFSRSTSDHYSAALNALNWSESDTETVGFTVEYDINEDLSTRLVYGWRNSENEYVADIDGTALPLSSFVTPFTSDAEQHSFEWQLTGTAFEGSVDWITGLYWFEEKGSDYSSSQSGAAILGGATNTIFDASAENNSESVFISATFHATDSINVVTGVRYTHDDKSVEVTPTQEIIGVTPAFCIAAVASLPNGDLTACEWSNQEDDYIVSYNVGVDWAATENVMVYAKTASASRSGGQNMRALSLEDAKPFEEETATDWELGIKSQLLDNTLQVNAAVYQTDYESVQQTDLKNDPASGANYTVVRNAGDATIDGFEVDFKWVVTDSWMVSGSAGILNWNFKDDTSISPSAPEKEASLRMNYLLPTDIGVFNFDVNYSYRGEMVSNTSGGRDNVRNYSAITVDSVELVGARITLDMIDDALSLSLWGTNLTDEEYRSSSLNIISGPFALSNSGVGAPRSFGLEATYKF